MRIRTKHTVLRMIDRDKNASCFATTHMCCIVWIGIYINLCVSTYKLHAHVITYVPNFKYNLYETFLFDFLTKYALLWNKWPSWITYMFMTCIDNTLCAQFGFIFKQILYNEIWVPFNNIDYLKQWIGIVIKSMITLIWFP